jgi:DNA ligase-1
LKQQLDLEVKKFFDLLANTPSIKVKKQLLAEKRDDGNVKKFLDYLLNPFFVTGISEKKIRKVVSVEKSVHFHSFHELMTYVRKNHTGSDDVLANTQAYLDDVNPELRMFYIGIIAKTIRIGCDAKTVNDAFGYEFIPQWEVQQAYQIGKLKMNENEWFSLSQKLNGVRGTYFEGKLISRQGKEFAGLEHILGDIQRLIPNSDEWVVDGELIRKNVEHISDNENFRLTTGILSQEDGDKRQIQLVIFDILPKAEFLRGESQLRYRDRLEQLKDLEQRIQRRNLSNLRIVDVLYTGNDMSMISKCLDRMIAEGKEGLMLNRNCKYFTRRHNGILKVKQFYTVDLEIVDLEEGTGRLSGTLGAFVVRYKNNYLRVGSGMTDDQRKKFWDDGLNLIGRVIEVKYKDESYDRRTGLRSLQFPIFVQLRELGKQESYD